MQRCRLEDGVSPTSPPVEVYGTWYMGTGGNSDECSGHYYYCPPPPSLPPSLRPPVTSRGSEPGGGGGAGGGRIREATPSRETTGAEDLPNLQD